MVSQKITVGLETTIKEEITSAASFGPGVLDYLLSTPATVKMIINASAKLLDPLLPPGYITVGKKIELSHEKPTLIGEKIALTTTVKDIHAETVYLEFKIHDDFGLICQGKHERQIVSQSKLMEIAYSRVGRNQ